MALLDAFDTEQGRFGLGLLAMAQPSRMSDGERMLGALQMLDQFKAQRSAAEERKADREERARVRMLQEQQIQMQLEAARRQQAREGAADAYRASLIPGGDGMGPTRPFDPLTAAMVLPPDQAEALFRIESERRKAQQQDQIQNAIRRAVSPVQPIEANAASGIPGPRPEALAAVGQRRPIDFQQLIAMGVPESMVKALAEAPNYGRPEVARTIEVDDGKGGKATRRESRFGEVIGEDLPAYVAPVQVNRGNQITFTRPAPGLSLSVAMSPGEAAADARARERLAFDRQNQQGAVTYQQDNDGNFVALPTRLAPGEVVRATPVMAPGGVAPLRGKGGKDEGEAARKRAEQIMAGTTMARDLLSRGPTQSGVGAGVDAGMRMFGVTTESAQVAAQLEALSGWLVANVPRMEGPQSNFDVKVYESMAAKVGDRSVPVAERLAALNKVEELQRKYAEVNGFKLESAMQPPKAKGPTLNRNDLYREADRIIRGGF